MKLPIWIPTVIVGVGIGILAITLLFVFVWAPRSRQHKKDELELRLYQAERHRLQELMSQAAKSKGAQRKSDDRFALWAFKPSVVTAYCPHGQPEVPPEVMQHYSNQGCFDLCPCCYPQQTFPPLTVPGGYITHAFDSTYSVPQQYMGADPVAFLEEARPTAVWRSRIRKAKSKSEFPTNPPPIAPPGFVTVPLVIETVIEK